MGPFAFFANKNSSSILPTRLSWLERHLAKVEVAGSNPVIRSTLGTRSRPREGGSSLQKRRVSAMLRALQVGRPAAPYVTGGRPDMQTDLTGGDGAPVIDHDYPLRPVPAASRKSLASLVAVLLGFTFFTPTMFAGADLGAAFSLGNLITIILAGSLLLGAYVAAIAAIGASTGLTTVLLSRYTLGRLGAIVGRPDPRGHPARLVRVHRSDRRRDHVLRVRVGVEPRPADHPAERAHGHHRVLRLPRDAGPLGGLRPAHGDPVLLGRV